MHRITIAEASAGNACPAITKDRPENNCPILKVVGKLGWPGQNRPGAVGTRSLSFRILISQ